MVVFQPGQNKIHEDLMKNCFGKALDLSKSVGIIRRLNFSRGMFHKIYIKKQTFLT